MANEITLKLGIEIVKGGSRVSSVADEKIDLPGDQKFSGVQTIGFADDEPIVFPADLIAAGISLVYVKNLSAANFCTVLADGTSFHLEPGQGQLFRYPATPATDPTITAQADTAAVDLEIIAAGPNTED